MSLLDQTQTQGLGTTSTTGLRVARVNLLPPEIEEARQRRRVQAGLGIGLAAVVVAAGAVFALQVHDKQQAQEQLDEAKAQTTRLQAEQAKYSDVPRTIASIDAAEQARATAMANDVEWYRSLNNLALTVPADVWFTNVTLGLGAAPTTAQPAA